MSTEEASVLENVGASTASTFILFGAIAFTTAAMTARACITGDLKAIQTLVSRKTNSCDPKGNSSSSSNNNNIKTVSSAPPLSWESFASTYTFLFHASKLGLILFGLYVVEHYPPFHRDERGSFDADFFVSCLFGLLFFGLGSITPNNNHSTNKIGAVTTTTTAVEPSTKQHDTTGTNTPKLRQTSSKQSYAVSNAGPVKSMEMINNGTLSKEQPVRGPYMTSNFTIDTPTGTMIGTAEKSTAKSSLSGMYDDATNIEDNDNEDNKSSSTKSMEEITLTSTPAAAPPNNHSPSLATIHESSSQSSLLLPEIFSVSQSLEWKGMMMSYFVVYQLTNGNTHNLGEVNIYHNLMRLGATCFVFMTSFGHTIYFYSRNDYSLQRILRVLLRYNLMALLLCSTMDLPYIFYYAVPIHSYFFLIVLAVMRIYQSNNYTQYGLRVKLLVTALIMFVVWDMNMGLYKLLHGMGFLGTSSIPSAPHGALWELYYHTHIHHWGMLAGMMYAVNYPVMALFLRKMEQQQHDGKKKWSEILAKASIGVALAAATILWIVGPFRTSVDTFSSLYTYFSFLPIVFYLFVRNLTKSLRDHHMAFFKNIGECSLEIFLLHHHLMLSIDQQTTVVLLPGYPKLNALLLCALRIWVAKIMRHLTLLFVDMVVPSNDTTTRCIYNLAVLAGAPLLLFAFAWVLDAMSLMSMVTLAVSTVVCGVVLYSFIVELTWKDYRSASSFGRQKKGQKEKQQQQPIDQVVNSKVGPHLTGLMVVILLGTGWQIADIMGASTPLTSLDESCSDALNDGLWTEVDACTEFQRGISARKYGMGSYFGTCQQKVLQFGWKTSANCRFRSRSNADLQDRLMDKYVVFVGDASVRHLFHATSRALGMEESGQFDGSRPDAGGNIKKTIGSVMLEFKWTPLVFNDLSMLKQFRTHDETSTSKRQPDLVVVGGGTYDKLHMVANEEDPASHQEAIQKLASEVELLKTSGIPTVWCVPTFVNTYALSVGDKKDNMNEEKVSEMRSLYESAGVNNAASFVIDGRSFTKGRQPESWDGVQYPLQVYDAGAQMLANALDWLLPQQVGIKKTAVSVDTPRTTADMGNPALGVMMLCLTTAALFFFDGYFGFSYFGAVWIRTRTDNPKYHSNETMSVLPNEIYKEAFRIYRQQHKLPLSMPDDDSIDRANPTNKSYDVLSLIESGSPAPESRGSVITRRTVTSFRS